MEKQAAIESCSNCRFYFTSERQYARQECRRMPKIAMKLRSSCAEWLGVGWPDAEPHEWCGEYAANLPIRQSPTGGA